MFTPIATESVASAGSALEVLTAAMHALIGRAEADAGPLPGDGALHALVSYGYSSDEQVAAVIQSAGGVHDTNASGETALHVAVRGCYFHGVYLLLAAGADPNAQTVDGDSPPLLATVSSEYAVELLDVLLEAGADVNCANSDGLTPLMACAAGSAPCALAAMIIQTGADLDLQDAHGCSALHFACHWNDAELVRLLVEAGADVALRTRGPSAFTPLELAQELRHEACVALLQSAEKKRAWRKVDPHQGTLHGVAAAPELSVLAAQLKEAEAAAKNAERRARAADRQVEDLRIQCASLEQTANQVRQELAHKMSELSARLASASALTDTWQAAAQAAQQETLTLKQDGQQRAALVEKIQGDLRDAVRREQELQARVQALETLLATTTEERDQAQRLLSEERIHAGTASRTEGASSLESMPASDVALHSPGQVGLVEEGSLSVASSASSGGPGAEFLDARELESDDELEEWPESAPAAEDLVPTSELDAQAKLAESELPAPWEAGYDDDGSFYFYNNDTGESFWEMPSALEEALGVASAVADSSLSKPPAGTAEGEKQDRIMAVWSTFFERLSASQMRAARELSDEAALSCLVEAVQKGDTEGALDTLRRGSVPAPHLCICSGFEAQMSILHMAAWNNDVHMLHILLDLPGEGADVDACDGLGNTPLHVAAMSVSEPVPNGGAPAGVPHALAAILQAGASVHVCNLAGDTPLSIAALGHSSDGVEWLLRYGASVHCAVAPDIQSHLPDSDSAGQKEYLPLAMSKAAAVDPLHLLQALEQELSAAMLQHSAVVVADEESEVHKLQKIVQALSKQASQEKVVSKVAPPSCALLKGVPRTTAGCEPLARPLSPAFGPQQASEQSGGTIWGLVSGIFKTRENVETDECPLESDDEQAHLPPPVLVAEGVGTSASMATAASRKRRLVRREVGNEGSALEGQVQRRASVSSAPRALRRHVWAAGRGRRRSGSAPDAPSTRTPSSKETTDSGPADLQGGEHGAPAHEPVPASPAPAPVAFMPCSPAPAAPPHTPQQPGSGVCARYVNTFQTPPTKGQREARGT